MAACLRVLCRARTSSAPFRGPDLAHGSLDPVAHYTFNVVCILAPAAFCTCPRGFSTDGCGRARDPSSVRNPMRDLSHVKAPPVSRFSPRQRPLSLALASVAVAVLLAACGQGSTSGAPAAGGAPGGAPPPAEVGVVTVTPGDVGLITELPGRLEASRVAQVRARAAGILQKRLFREGSDVKAGQPLFSIDPAPYAATLQSAQAQLGARRSQPVAGQRHWPSATSRWSKPTPSASRTTPTRVAAQKQAEADVAAAGGRADGAHQPRATPASRRRSPAASAARW